MQGATGQFLEDSYSDLSDIGHQDITSGLFLFVLALLTLG